MHQWHGKLLSAYQQLADFVHDTPKPVKMRVVIRCVKRLKEVIVEDKWAHSLQVGRMNCRDTFRSFLQKIIIIIIIISDQRGTDTRHG